jgi:hypothetical protein
MDFRSRLLATLRRVAPLFEVPGVMVVGSEVPNLLQPGVAATLVVSQDVDIGVPVARHAAVKARLAQAGGGAGVSSSPAVALLEARLRAMRARLAVRAWEYRQRDHAKGVWFRLRRLLAHSASALSLPEAEARRLLAEGYAADPVGALLEPPKVLLVVPEERLRDVPGRSPIPLRLGPDLLAARWVALVPFAPLTSERLPR